MLWVRAVPSRGYRARYCYSIMSTSTVPGPTCYEYASFYLHAWHTRTRVLPALTLDA
jgi:hypothetical protein